MVNMCSEIPSIINNIVGNVHNFKFGVVANPPPLRVTTGFVTRVTRKVLIVEQKLLIFRSTRVYNPQTRFNDVLVTKSLDFCVLTCISFWVIALCVPMTYGL